MIREAAEWVTEQWCHAHPLPVGTATVARVVVTAALAAQVVAEAEVLCAATAVVEEAAR